jgi:hypothetical protein
MPHLRALPRFRLRSNSSWESRFWGRLIPDQIFYLATTPEIIDLKTNRMSTLRRKLHFTIVQGIEQQTGLELISHFRIGKTVDEALDSHFFRGKSYRRHDGPPRRHLGLGSLAGPTVDSSGLRHQNKQG